MARTSRFLSIGHPDRMADYINEYVHDRFIEIDGMCSYDMNVVVDRMIIHLLGSVDVNTFPTDETVKEWVREAIRRIGYTDDYLREWGVDSFGNDNAVTADNFEIDLDIRCCNPSKWNLWNFTGTYIGLALNDAYSSWMPKDIWLAKQICNELYSNDCCGIDVSVQVTLAYDKRPMVCVETPVKNEGTSGVIQRIVNMVCDRCVNERPERIIVSSPYKKHLIIDKVGFSGRSISCDFYGSNCECPDNTWIGKDVSHPALTLNAYARKLAVDKIKEKPELQCVKCFISCQKNNSAIMVVFLDAENNLVDCYEEEATPRWVAEQLGLMEAFNASKCFEGLPYSFA